MDDYGKIIEKEKILKSKENLLDDTIIKINFQNMKL